DLPEYVVVPNPLLQLAIARVRLRKIPARLLRLLRNLRRGVVLKRWVNPRSLAIREIDADQLARLRLTDDGIVLHDERLQSTNQRFVTMANRLVLLCNWGFISRVVDRCYFPAVVEQRNTAARLGIAFFIAAIKHPLSRRSGLRRA